MAICEMEQPKEFAKITKIEQVISLKIKKLSWLRSKIIGHRYSVIVNGKTQSYSCPVDRVVFKHTKQIIADALLEVELYSLADLLMGAKLNARITEYPNKEYSVIYISNIVHDKREKLIERIFREDESYQKFARLSILIDGYIGIINKVNPNKTICPECHADDFTHVEGCIIGNEMDAWWDKHKEVE